MFRKDVNSVKAEMLIPSQAEDVSLQACVETMRVLPHPAFGQKGKDIVRTVEKGIGRGGRNGRPLALSLIEIGNSHFVPQLFHSGLIRFTALLAWIRDQVEIFLHNSKFHRQAAMWQLSVSKDINDTLHVRLANAAPSHSGIAGINHPIRVGDREIGVRTSDMAAQSFGKSPQKGLIVRTLINVGLWAKKQVVVNRLTSPVLSMAVIPTDRERTISEKEADKLGQPSQLYGALMDIVNSVHNVMIAQLTMNDKLVLKVTDCHDITSELTAGVGTYPVPDGLTRDTFESGFQGKIGGVQIFEDGNLTIDSSDDTKGGVFAGGRGGAIVLVQGRSPWKTTRDEPSLGGGGTSVWLWDEYAYGERSAGNWLKEIYSDATAPTS